MTPAYPMLVGLYDLVLLLWAWRRLIIAMTVASILGAGGVFAWLAWITPWESRAIVWSKLEWAGARLRSGELARKAELEEGEEVSIHDVSGRDGIQVTLRGPISGRLPGRLSALVDALVEEVDGPVQRNWQTALDQQESARLETQRRLVALRAER